MAETKSIDDFLNSPEMDENISSIAERSKNIDSIMEQAEGDIKKFQKQFEGLGLSWIKEKELQNKILSNTQILAKKGIDINKLYGDYEQKFRLSLSILQKSTLTSKQKHLLEEKLYNQYKIEEKEAEKKQIQEKEISIKKEKIGEAYDKVANVFSKFSGPFSGATDKFFETRKEKTVGNIASKSESGILSKALDSFAKFPVLFAGVAAGIGFLISRLTKLIGADLNISSDIVKSTGLRALTAGKIKSEVQGAAASLKVFYGGEQEEAQKKAAEGAGALLKEFGNIKYITKESITNVISLSEKLGISAEEAAKYFLTLNQTLGLNNKEIGSFGEYLNNITAKSGQSLRDVTEDIRNNLEFTSIYGSRFAGDMLAGANSIGESAVLAKSMGSNLKSVSDFSQKFLTIEDTFSNIRDLSIITGKKYNPFEFMATARFGTGTQQVMQQKRVMEDLVELSKKGQGIENDRYMIQKAASLITGGDITNLKEMLGHMKRGKDFEAAQKEISKQKNLDEKRKKGISSYATSLGILELKTPGDLVLSKILESIDKVLIPIAETISRTVFGIFDFMQNPSKVVQEYTKQGTAADKYRDFVNTLTFGMIDFYGGAGGRRGRGGGIVSEPNITKKATGGIVSNPVIAGEAGPEAILPFTGSGKKSFTEPFLESMQNKSNQEIVAQIKELNTNIKSLLKNPRPIENRIYMDSRQIAKGLTDLAMMS